jgi:hypothetical protein
MKKRIAIAVLAALLILAIVFAVSCNKESTPKSIAFKQGTLKNAYKVGDTVDLSDARIIVTYDDGSTKELSLTALGVTYTRFATDTAKSLDFEVKYMGLSAKAPITISQRDPSNPNTDPPHYPDPDPDPDPEPEPDLTNISRFGLPANYLAYQSAVREATSPSAEDDFAVKNVKYMVGSANKFLFLPDVYGTNKEGVEGAFDTVDINVKVHVFDATTAQYVELADGEVATHVTIDNNTYTFLESSVGNSYKIFITLADTYATTEGLEKTIEAEVTVVDGYNVYDEYGLSMFDTTDSGNFGVIRSRTNAADSQPMNDYTDIKAIILHSDIVVTRDALPTQYFWTQYDENYETSRAAVDSRYIDIFEGSLKSGNAHNALYTNTTNTALYGNYFTVSVKGYSAADTDANGIYQVYGNSMNTANPDSVAYPMPSWSLFGYVCDNGSIKNLRAEGNSAPSAPSGLMFLYNNTHYTVIDNVVASNFYTHIYNDKLYNSAVVTEMTEKNLENKYTMDLLNVRFYNSDSVMVYENSTKGVNIVDSVMKKAGGPVLLLVDKNDRTYNNLNADSALVGPIYKVDADSILESWIDGSELWFKLNPAAKVIMPDIVAIDNVLAGTGKTFVKAESVTDSTKNPAVTAEVKRINMIALVMPSGDKLFNGNNDPVRGEVSVGGDSFYFSQNIYTTLRDTKDKSLWGNPTVGTLGYPILVSGTTGMAAAHDYFGKYVNVNPRLGVAPFDVTKTSDVYGLYLKSGKNYFMVVLGGNVPEAEVVEEPPIDTPDINATN